MLSEVVTRNCVRNPGGHAESIPRPSEEGVSFYHVLRPLDRAQLPAQPGTCMADGGACLPSQSPIAQCPYLACLDLPDSP